jgi:hypothetical protein
LLVWHLAASSASSSSIWSSLPRLPRGT